MGNLIEDAPPTLDGLTFHHFGLAVAEAEAAFRYLETLGYTQGHQVFDPQQKVNLAMRHHTTMPDVEVIWPGDGPSPIDKLIKRNGPMIYHICYECREPEARVAAWEAAGHEIVAVSPPKPALLFGGRAVSFYTVAGFGLVEFLQADI